MQEAILLPTPGASLGSSKAARLSRAVRRVQAAVRERLRRRRRAVSWFELEVQNEWGVLEPRRSRVSAPQRCPQTDRR